jgi:GT2 family glycosyltransferase
MENKIDINMACIWRHAFEVETINSLRYQKEFGTANIILNSYTDQQFEIIQNAFNGDDRIKLYRHNNEKASNSKLRYVGDGVNEYVGFFDNDLLFPPDYLAKLIAGIDKYNAYCSLHGVILDKGLIQSYYRNRRVYRGLAYVGADVEVDIASNCCSGFKRKWFNNLSEWFDMVGEVSMDDIYTNYFAKKKGIRRFVLKHPEEYLVHKEQLPDELYVFDQHKNNDTIQTVFVNSFFKKL